MTKEQIIESAIGNKNLGRKGLFYLTYYGNMDDMDHLNFVADVISVVLRDKRRRACAVIKDKKIAVATDVSPITGELISREELYAKNASAIKHPERSKVINEKRVKGA